MDYLFNGFTLETAPGTFPISTDSMVLSHFVKLTRNGRVADLGAGCGTLGLLLCATDSTCTVTGLEIDPIAHAAAEENIRSNGLEARMASICADLRNLPGDLAPGSFHVCVSNPPYFSGGPASATLPVARQDNCCPPEAPFKAASTLLKFGGDFFLVHKPEKLAQLIGCAAAVKLEAKRLCLIRHRDGGPITTVLLQFRKGGKPGLIIEEQSLYTSLGEQTPYFREVYHI